MFTTRTSKLFLTTVAASFAVAAPASADSIVYLKGGDVYLTTTDAARQFQVTSGGGYTAVSQADDGTILATTTAGKFRRLDRMGTVLSEVGSIAGGSSAFSFKGPYDADISPNGAKLAYGYTYSGYTSDPNGGTWVNEGNATAFAKAASETTSSDTGFKSSREYDAPEWVDDQRTIVSNGPGYPSSPVAVVEAGSGNSRSWFTDPENTHPHDATLSRNWRMLAMTNGTRDELHVYRDQDGLLLGGVNACFYYSPAPGDGGVRYSSPTFNANGTLLVFADGQGLEIAPVGSSSSTCPDGLDSRKVLPGASSPDWGPADVPTERPVTRQPDMGDNGGGPKPTPTPPGTGPGTQSGTVGTKDAGSKSGTGTGGAVGGTNGDGAKANGAAISLVATKTSLRKALGGGLSVTATAPVAGAVKVDASVGGKVVATGTATAKAPGLVTVKVQFTKAAKRRLATSRKTTLTLTASQGLSAGTLQVTLRR
ncbi:MAG: hypothetical protein AAGC46_13250 [Solirubrobacteraceae bacterium]|nr:hypothetical protein [Patulibacter sp.]